MGRRQGSILTCLGLNVAGLGLCILVHGCATYPRRGESRSLNVPRLCLERQWRKHPKRIANR